jgi:putative transposase
MTVIREPNTLGSIIAGYKARVTSKAMKELGIACIWQRNYYEHILRNPEVLVRIREYIRQNPTHWEEDALF